MNLFLAALVIFLLRLIDQALTTIRGLVVSKKPILGAFIGLVESAIWIIVVSKVINDIDEPVLIFGYALGFSAGTLLGSYIERFIGIGSTVVRVFSSAKSPSVAKALRDKNFMVTVINGEGRDGAVRICWCIIPRRKSKSVLAIIKNICPNAYITTELANPTSLKK